MWELTQAIPDADEVLALEAEEWGARLLLLRQRLEARREEQFHPHNLENEVLEQRGPYGQPQPYRPRVAEVGLALSEAWAWLEAQGLIVPATGINGSNGFRRLSRRARRFEHAADIKTFALARRLSKEALHPRIARTVWAAFVRGEFDVAVFQAMKAVEVAVREAGGLQEPARAPRHPPRRPDRSDRGGDVRQPSAPHRGPPAAGCGRAGRPVARDGRRRDRAGRLRRYLPRG